MALKKLAGTSQTSSLVRIGLNKIAAESGRAPSTSGSAEPERGEDTKAAEAKAAGDAAIGVEADGAEHESDGHPLVGAESGDDVTDPIETGEGETPPPDVTAPEAENPASTGDVHAAEENTEAATSDGDNGPADGPPATVTEDSAEALSTVEGTADMPPPSATEEIAQAPQPPARDRGRADGLDNCLTGDQLAAWCKGQVRSMDLVTVRRVVSRAVELKLPPAELARLAAIMAKSAGKDDGLSKDVIQIMMKDERHRDPTGKVVHTPRACAGAIVSILLTQYGFRHLVFDQGQVYGYRDDDPEHVDETGHYVVISTGDVFRIADAALGENEMLHTQKKQAEVWQALTSMLEDKDFFSKARYGINLRNGFLRFNEQTGEAELLPISCEHRARSRLNVAYDPQAQAPTFIRYRERALPHPEERRNLEEILAAVALRVPARDDKARRIAMFYGPTRTGKSVAIDIACMLVPATRVGSVPPETWANEYYRGKLGELDLNVVTELTGASTLRGEQVKRIASGEKVSARNPFGMPFSFECHAIHLTATNTPPRIDDRTEAIERRFKA